MAQTFDIRFAKSAGLAAFLEVPENRFRWKGGGLLRIDSRGISIGAKRGLLALLGGKRTQRIPSENLRAVYREGEALRVEYQSGSANVVLPFWADNRDAAAQIVRMLPTRQTVEIEETTNFAKPRADWRVLLTIGISIAAIAIGIWAVYQRGQQEAAPNSGSAIGSEVTQEALQRPSEVSSQSAEATPQGVTPASVTAHTSSSARPAPERTEEPAFPLDTSRSAMTRPQSEEQPEISAPDETAIIDMYGNTSTRRTRALAHGVVPYELGTPTIAAARRQLALFLAESDTLRAKYRFVGNAVSAQSLEDLWWKVTVRVSNSPDFEGRTLQALQELELAISRSWRRALSLRAEGHVALAEAEIEFAEMLETRARQFVQ